MHRFYLLALAGACPGVESILLINLPAATGGFGPLRRICPCENEGTMSLLESAHANAFLRQYKRLLGAIAAKPMNNTKNLIEARTALYNDGFNKTFDFDSLYEESFINAVRNATYGMFVYAKKYRNGYALKSCENIWFCASGLTTPLEEMIPEWCIIDTAVLPYGGFTICDGLIMDRHVSIGPNMVAEMIQELKTEREKWTSAKLLASGKGHRRSGKNEKAGGTMTVQELRNIYQIKVTLKDAKPPIWRRLLVPGNIKLNRLHVTLQIAMGWTDSHMHQFIAGREYYSTPDPDFDFDCKPESKTKLDDLLKKEKTSIIYEYDFGDGWEHKIVLEKILPFTTDFKAPVCLKGVGACPPEDCGGPFGYAHMLEVIGNPGHPEHDEMVEWLGCDDFDPDFIDIEDVNEGLKINCHC
jgi:hypothetical protein